MIRRFARWALGPYRALAWRVDDLADAAIVSAMNAALTWARAHL